MGNMFFEMVLAACMWFVILQGGVALLVLSIACRKKKVRCILCAVFAGLLLSWSMAAFGAMAVTLHEESDYYLSEMNRFFGYSEYEPDYGYSYDDYDYDFDYDYEDFFNQNSGYENIEDFEECTYIFEGKEYSYHTFLWKGKLYSSYADMFIETSAIDSAVTVAYFHDTRSGQEEIKGVKHFILESGHDALVIDGEIYCASYESVSVFEFYAKNDLEKRLIFVISGPKLKKYIDIDFDKATFDALDEYSDNEVEINHGDVDNEFYIARMLNYEMLYDFVLFYQIGDEFYVHFNEHDTGDGTISVYKLESSLADKVRDAYKQVENSHAD